MFAAAPHVSLDEIEKKARIITKFIEDPGRNTDSIPSIRAEYANLLIEAYDYVKGLSTLDQRYVEHL